MKKRKDEFTESQSFDYTELTALCEHLEIREREGKRLKDIDKYSLTYDITEPREIRYSAVIFNKELMHKDFVATCEQEGWEYVDRHNELYIFRTQNPEATEIITDEKENFRAVTKAFLLNPRFLGFSVVTFNTAMRLITHCITRVDLPWNPPLPADALFFLHLFLTSIPLALVFIQTGEFLEWYIKAKKSVRNGREIPFMNLKERNIKLIGRRILYSMWIIAVSVLFIMIFHGYFFEKTIFGVLAIALGVAGGIIIYKLFNVKGKLIKLLLMILSLAVISSASYGFYTSFETAYNKNPYIIREDNIPVSVADFNYGECQCTNEISTYSCTRLAQYYYILSKCSCHDSYMRYTIFVCNKPEIRAKYIEDLKEEESDNLTPYKSENSDWDEQYRIVTDDGKLTEYGIAVKGNTVVYLYSYSLSDYEADFFDVAYNKMFG